MQTIAKKRLPRRLFRHAVASSARLRAATVLAAAAILLSCGGRATEHVAAAVSQAGPRLPVRLVGGSIDAERREARFVFTRALGKDRRGVIPFADPASISPAVAGTWKWCGDHTLCFTAAATFAAQTVYRFRFNTHNLLRPGEVLAGRRTLLLSTTRFRVTGADIHEEPTTEAPGTVTLRGVLSFNLAVDPELLIRHLHIHQATAPDLSVDVSIDARGVAYRIPFRSAPIGKKVHEQEFIVVVDGELVPAVDGSPLEKDFTQRVLVGSREHLRVRRVEGKSSAQAASIRIAFSSPVSAENARRHIHLEPAATYNVDVVHNSVVLNGGLEAGVTYAVTVAASLSGEDGSVLAGEYTTRVTIPDLAPSVSFRGNGIFLRRSGPRALEIETTNVEHVKLSVSRVYPNNLFFLARYYSYLLNEKSGSGAANLPGPLGNTILRKTLQVPERRNQAVTTLLHIDELTGKKPGFYRIGLSLPGEHHTEFRWVHISDIGIVAKTGRQGILVWASSFADLSPVAGARVQVLSGKNQILAEGRTDTNGLARLPRLDTATGRGDPFLVTVRSGSDRSFLLFGDTRIATAGLAVGGATGSPAYDAYLYGERDIYRPGETVRGLALIRTADLSLPPHMPVLLRHKDPRGRVRDTLRLDLDDDGAASFAYPLAPSERTGHHRFELVIGEKVAGVYRFQVEEFEPDRIAVRVHPASKRVRAGQEIAYRTSADYLFGAPGAGLRVETRVHLRARRFAPAGYAGYRFADEDRHFVEQELFTDERRLDDRGHAGFTVSVPGRLAPPSALEAIITARVSEAGGRGVSARSHVAIDPVPYYLGLRQVNDSSPPPGNAMTFDYVAVEPGGKATPAARLRAEFYRARWHTVLRRSGAGGYRYESRRVLHLVDTKTIAAGKTHGTFTFTPATYGRYRVVLSDPAAGAAAALSVYAGGWGYSPWAIDNPARLELQLDRGEYRAGDTATVDIRAPFAGKLLLSVERGEVRYTQVRRLTGNTARLRIPVRGGYRPNVYVTAILVRSARDLGPGEVARAFGATVLNVDRETHRLPVKIDVAPESRPGKPLRISVSAEPGAALTVAAVDEGILRLVAQKNPDPFAYFYRRRALRVRSFDIFSQLFPDAAPIEGASPRGGGRAAEGMYLRTQPLRRSRPVAFWSGILHAGPDGRAQTTFDVPEFAGRLRVVAVAHRGNRFGAAHVGARVRNPIVVTPTVPRVLSFQEDFRVPVTIRNGTGKAGRFTVTLDSSGPIRIAGDHEQLLDIPPDQQRTLRFALASGETEGDVTLTLRVTGNGETTLAHASVSVRSDLPARIVHRSGRLQAGETRLPVSAAGNFRPGTIQRRLHVGPLPLVQLAGRLEELLRYPYGCVEQTTSRAFPLVHFADLARPLAPKLLANDRAARLVQAAIERLSTMQIYNGAFAMWPGGESEYPWGSVYATHFLVEARNAGHRVEAAVYDAALSHLESSVRDGLTARRHDLERRVYAFYVLARAGRPDLAGMQVLRDGYGERLSLAFRALLGAAYALAGRPEELDRLTRDIDEVPYGEPDSGGTLNSTVRNRALFLLALLDGNPDDPRIPDLVRELLAGARAASPWSTQEEAFTFLALGRFARLQQERPACGGQVASGARTIGSFAKEGGAIDVEGDEAISVKLDDSPADCRPFYSLRVRGIPADDTFHAAASGLELERTLLDRDGRAVDPRHIRQGDLLILRTTLRSPGGALENIVIQQLLPAGVEVENPRLQSSERTPWIKGGIVPANVDIRRDRLLLFVGLPDDHEHSFYSQLRAVNAGHFRFPPIQAQAMYATAKHAVGPRGWLNIEER